MHVNMFLGHVRQIEYCFPGLRHNLYKLFQNVTLQSSEAEM